MDINKDYYATLGVLPSAEQVLISAAYKVLAQRYHPDKLFASSDSATKKMAELNEAYSILSNEVKRREYDKARGNKTQSGDSYFSESGGDDPIGDDPLKKDWEIAVSYFPDLLKIEKEISKISWRLSSGFKAYLLESKLFEKRVEIAADMERRFLETYFGTNPEIVAFAKRIIFSEHREAARALNEAVRVLGNSINADTIISKVSLDFDLGSLRSQGYKVSEYIKYLESINYVVSPRKNGWEIREPLGGRARIENFDELSEYVSARKAEKRQK